MKLSDVIRAAITASKVDKPRKPKGYRAPHEHDEERSDEWNAWRERSALWPQKKPGPARRPAPKRQPTPAELRARRLSSRASRRRAS